MVVHVYVSSRNRLAGSRRRDAAARAVSLRVVDGRVVVVASSEAERLAAHDERMRRFGCAHSTRVEYGGAWLCLDCFEAFGPASVVGVLRGR